MGAGAAANVARWSPRTVASLIDCHANLVLILVLVEQFVRRGSVLEQFVGAFLEQFVGAVVEQLVGAFVVVVLEQFVVGALLLEQQFRASGADAAGERAEDDLPDGVPVAERERSGLGDRGGL